MGASMGFGKCVAGVIAVAACLLGAGGADDASGGDGRGGASGGADSGGASGNAGGA